MIGLHTVVWATREEALDAVSALQLTVAEESVDPSRTDAGTTPEADTEPETESPVADMTTDSLGDDEARPMPEVESLQVDSLAASVIPTEPESEPESPIAGEPESFVDYVDILWRHYHNFIDGSDELVWRLGKGTLNEAGSHPGNFRAAWQLSRVATTLRTWASRGHIARDNDRLIASRFLKAYLGLTRLWATARCPDGWGIPHTTPDIVWRAVMQGAHPALHRLLVGAEAHGLMVEDGQAFVSAYRHAWVRHSGAPTVDARLDCALAGLELEFPADLGLFYGEDVTLETLLTLLSWA
ncbi:hypothetical protein J8273_2193 [Carpediemonas membranifera]|uniref:Uncharacterized protein n=1 Tax=Carpediemonas membranifera TaxID=201153 RepID=A0A8J6AWE7_9EUKA|nr:hypothetical protein J8273_2193 [Carpediemonas membranifera]|eukprot:KAG9395863.1 hypothetical protein J8273_2193 [Carpediemonas membranifera]